MTTPQEALSMAMEILGRIVDSERCPIAIRCDAQQLLRRWQRGEFLDEPIKTNRAPESGRATPGNVGSGTKEPGHGSSARFHLKTWIAKLLIGIGNIPCDLPKIEMDPKAGDELFLEVRNRNGEIVLRVKADIQGALDIELEKIQKQHQSILDNERKEKAQ